MTMGIVLVDSFAARIAAAITSCRCGLTSGSGLGHAIAGKPASKENVAKDIALYKSFRTQASGVILDFILYCRWAAKKRP